MEIKGLSNKPVNPEVLECKNTNQTSKNFSSVVKSIVNSNSETKQSNAKLNKEVRTSLRKQAADKKNDTEASSELAINNVMPNANAKSINAANGNDDSFSKKICALINLLNNNEKEVNESDSTVQKQITDAKDVTDTAENIINSLCISGVNVKNINVQNKAKSDSFFTNINELISLLKKDGEKASEALEKYLDKSTVKNSNEEDYTKLLGLLENVYGKNQQAGLSDSNLDLKEAVDMLLEGSDSNEINNKTNVDFEKLASLLNPVQLNELNNYLNYSNSGSTTVSEGNNKVDGVKTSLSKGLTLNDLLLFGKKFSKLKQNDKNEINTLINDLLNKNSDSLQSINLKSLEMNDASNEKDIVNLLQQLLNNKETLSSKDSELSSNNISNLDKVDINNEQSIVDILKQIVNNKNISDAAQNKTINSEGNSNQIPITAIEKNPLQKDSVKLKEVNDLADSIIDVKVTSQNSKTEDNGFKKLNSSLAMSRGYLSDINLTKNSDSKLVNSTESKTDVLNQLNDGLKSSDGIKLDNGIINALGNDEDNSTSKDNVSSLTKELKNVTVDLNGSSNKINLSADLKTDKEPVTAYISKPEDLVNTIVERFKTIRMPDTTELSVKLKPKELGEVIIKVALEKGQINGNITVEKKEVAVMLQNQVDNLKQELKNNNVNLNNISVNIENNDKQDGKGNFAGGNSHGRQNNKNNNAFTEIVEEDKVNEEEGFSIVI